VREGNFTQQTGETTLRLVGDVQSVGTVEVTRIQKKSLLELYPLSCAEMITQVRARLPATVKEHMIFQAVKENDLKNNPDYSSYIFRNKRQEEKFKTTGEKPKSITSIYNHNAVEFLAKILRNI
jgi:hypothetical protein